MMTAEDNLKLLQRIEADRQFLIMALQSNPALLEHEDAQVRAWFTYATPPAPTFACAERTDR